LKSVLKTLIKEGILDYKALVLKYYHKFDLSEQEAIALIKLNTLLEEKQRIIKPSKFAQWLSLSCKETEELLNGLMAKGYLNITLVEAENGKETETFTIDYFLTKVISHLQRAGEEASDDDIAKVVSYLENTLQKPLNALDLELVKKWIHDEEYSMSMIEDATMNALKRKRTSLKYIDHLLLNQLQDVSSSTRPKNEDALKDFHKLWEE